MLAFQTTYDRCAYKLSLYTVAIVHVELQMYIFEYNLIMI